MVENTKYLYKTGGGLPAVLFISHYGIVKNITDEIRQHLRREGAAITEGWKGA